MRVPFLDVGESYRSLRADLDAAYRRVMDSGWYILGEEVSAFEDEFAAFCGVRYCVAVGTGLDAIALALRASGVGPGDQVIVPAHTFIGTWLAVTSVGAEVVPVEPDETLNIDWRRLESSITSRTKAIVPVHLYGRPADVEAIRRIADARSIPVIEDAAQAHGARLGNARAGSLGAAAAFSFYPAKNLGAFGDGGAVVTNDAALAARLRQLRNYGSERKYEHEMQGTNSRLDALQAAFLHAKLRHLDAWNRRRAEVATRYREGLAALQAHGVQLPAGDGRAASSWHLFVIRVQHRGLVREGLAAHGIETAIHYPVPPHRSGAYRHLGFAPGSFPLTEAACDSILSLPISPHMTDSQIGLVIDALYKTCIPQ